MKTQVATILGSVLVLAIQAQAKVTFTGIDTNWKGQQRNRWMINYDADHDQASEIENFMDSEFLAPKLGNLQHGQNGNGNVGRNYYFHVTIAKGEGADINYFNAIKIVFGSNEICGEMGLESGWMTQRCEEAECGNCD